MKILFMDPSIRAENVLDIETLPCGGRKTSMFYLPDELCKRGHRCWVVANIKRPGVTMNGTIWCSAVPSYDFDVLVLNRGISDCFPGIKAKFRVLWTHDLPHSGFALQPKNLNAVGLTVFMSKYAEKVWRKFYKDIGKGAIIPNGVDKSIFKPRTESSLGGPLVFASAPNRGLKRLPLIFEAVKTRLSGCEVRMVALSNMGKLHPGEVEDVDSDGYELSYKGAEEAGIQVINPVPQPELARYLSGAAATVIPTGFPEICSNLVLQSLACGTPVITTGGVGATPEWVRHGKNGLLTQFRPEDYMIYTVEMVRNCVDFLGNDKLALRLRKGAAKTRNVLGWPEIARAWEKAIGRNI